MGKKLTTVLQYLLPLGLMFFVAWFFSGSTSYGIDAVKYRLAAQFYAENGFSIHQLDPFNRGVAKLYPMVLSPLFDRFDIQTAIQLARVLNVILFFLTFLALRQIANFVIKNSWNSWLASLVGVCTPWLVFSGSVMTESLAFFCFGWAMFFMLKGILERRWYVDLIAIGSAGICALVYVHFFVLIPVYFLAALVLNGYPALVAEQHKSSWKRVSKRTVTFFSWHPSFVLVFLFTTSFLVMGRLTQLFDKLLDPYQGIRQRKQLPGNLFAGFGFEFATLSFGVGLFAALIGCSWFIHTIGKRSFVDKEKKFALLITFAMFSLFVVALIAQGGYLGAVSEERYYFYAVPFLWIGTFAALEMENRSLLVKPAFFIGFLAFASAGLVDLAIQPTAESLIVAPSATLLMHFVPDFSVQIANAVGFQGELFSTKDALAYTAILITVLTGVALHRSKRLFVGVLVCSVSLQLLMTASMFRMYAGKVQGIRTSLRSYGSIRDLGWVDRTLPKGKKAAWVFNQTADRSWQQISTLFWNGKMSADIAGPGVSLDWFAGSASFTLPQSVLQPDNSGISPELQPEFVVQKIDSPYFQLATKRVLRTSATDQIELAEVQRPLILTWTTKGLDGAGLVPPAASAEFTVPSASAQNRLAITMLFHNPSPSEEVTFVVQADSQKKEIKLAPSASQRVGLTVCSAKAGSITTVQPATAPPVPDQPVKATGPKLVSVQLLSGKNRCDS